MTERQLYICTAPSFFANRKFNPGDCARSAKSPGPNFRLFNPETDRQTVRTVDIPAEN